MAEETKIQEAARGNRKERVGEVLSNKMAKTIVVRVERRFPHPKFKKVVTGFKKFYAHDEKSEAKPGDRVRIVTGSGAGYGDPALRDAAAVADDLLNGYVTPERAGEVYGTAGRVRMAGS